MRKNKNKAYHIVYFIFGLILFFPSLSYADCDIGLGNGTRPLGAVVYNTNYDVLQVCRGDGLWHALGPVGAGGDTTPDAFGFTDQTGVATSTLISSNSVNITGITGSVSVSVSGDGSPQVRVNGGSWTAGPTSITDGQSLEVRLTSNASNSTMNSATVTVGTVSDQWDVTTAGADPCAGSPSPGDVCADGTVYAGLSPDGNVAMYTTAADEGGFAWNNGNSSGYTTTSQTSTTTGEANTTNLLSIDSDSGVGGTQPHLAAQQCANSTANGKTDWYLPAKGELNVLYTNKAAIGGFNISGSFPAGSYWSSSESTLNTAWDQSFSDGGQNTTNKTYGLSVRCVRR